MNVLEKALEIMRERGMCKFVRQDTKGHVCLYGALAAAHSGNANGNYDYNAAKVMDHTATELFPGRSMFGAATVNNHLATTQEDVELILKHAAHKYDLIHGEQE